MNIKNKIPFVNLQVKKGHNVLDLEQEVTIGFIPYFNLVFGTNRA